MQFDDVSFQIGDIGEGEHAHTGNLRRDNFANHTAAVPQDLCCCFLDIIDLEGQVHDPFPIGRSCRSWIVRRVLVDFECGAVVAVSRKSKVSAGKTCVGNAGPLTQPVPEKIALGQDKRATEDILVESRQTAPVSSDDICMLVSASTIFLPLLLSAWASMPFRSEYSQSGQTILVLL